MWRATQGKQLSCLTDVLQILSRNILLDPTISFILQLTPVQIAYLCVKVEKQGKIWAFVGRSIKRNNLWDGLCYKELRRAKLEGLNNPDGFTGQVKSLPSVWSYLYSKGLKGAKSQW